MQDSELTSLQTLVDYAEGLRSQGDPAPPSAATIRVWKAMAAEMLRCGILRQRDEATPIESLTVAEFTPRRLALRSSPAELVVALGAQLRDRTLTPRPDRLVESVPRPSAPRHATYSRTCVGYPAQGARWRGMGG